MARARCDWCKKRRKTQYIRVMMERMLPDCEREIRWYRYWFLCDECETACEDTLKGWPSSMRE